MDQINWKALSVGGCYHIMMMMAAFLLLCPRVSFAHNCTGPHTAGELREELWGSYSLYDKRTRPNMAKQATETTLLPADAPPDVAKVQIHVVSVKNVEQKRGEFEVQLWFRQRWNDYRLKYASEKDGGCFRENSREGFPASDFNEIWHPDIYSENQNGGKTLASAFWVYPNGDVVYARSQVVTVSCNMDLLQFPRDSQTCNFRVGTWLEDASQITMKFWDPVEDNVKAAVTLADQESSSVGGSFEWNISFVKTEDFIGTFGATQQESYADFFFTITRESQYYIDFVIVPSLGFVFIGWTSFFIDRSVAPARVALSTLCFLTNINFLGAQLATLPKLSNEVWLLRFLTVSMIFTFYAVIEYVLCNYLLRVEKRVTAATKLIQEERRKKAARAHSVPPQPPMKSDVPLPPLPPPPPKPTLKPLTKHDLDVPKIDKLLLTSRGEMWMKDQHVDIFSRWAYPLCYVICIVLLYTDQL